MLSIKTLSSLLSRCSLGHKTSSNLKFSTMQLQPVMQPGKLSAACENMLKKTTQTGTSSGLLQKIQAAPCYNMNSVRTNVRYHYYPRALKRINKFGLQKRLSSKTQREIIMRKMIKGKHTFSTFDRIPNQLPAYRFRTSTRINLFDRKIGYKKPKKPEPFRF